MARDWQPINDLLRMKTDVELGALLHEYLEEAMHGSFEGFTSHDVTGIHRMLTDMALYDKNR